MTWRLHGMLGAMTFLLSCACVGCLPWRRSRSACRRLPPERLIDLNLANQGRLEMVKGIGPQLSERILAERAQGRFESWPDFIARMKGIGPSHASRLSAAGLRVGGQAYAGSGEEPPAPAK
jgi:competence protein ComEA